MHGLWYAVLEENYARVVKNTVEEGSESFGYMLCLTATRLRLLLWSGATGAVAAALIVDDSHRRACRRRWRAAAVNREFSTSV